jgi:hypothetical protein
VTVVTSTLRLHRSANPRDWRLLRDAPAHICVAAFAAISLIVLGISASMRDVYLLPVLPAAILLGLPALVLEASTALGEAKRWINIAFGVSAFLVGLIWLLLVTSGNLSLMPWLATYLVRWLPLPFELAMSWPAAVAAASTLIIWSYIVRRDPLESSTIAWCCGIAMIWVVISALLLPWIDTARSYRQVFSEVKTHITPTDGCVATLNFGESELALLDYVTNATITRSYLGHSGTGDRSRPNAAAETCNELIVLSNRASGRLSPNLSRWTRVWSGSRPADRNEQFSLYRKQG